VRTPTALAGPPLGLIEGYAYPPAQVSLHPGDSLLLYTDGVTDSMNTQSQSFGMKGVREALLNDDAGLCRPDAAGCLLLEAVRSGIIDDGAHERLRLAEGVADDHSVHQLGDLLDQLLFLAVLDDEATGRRAALAGGKECGLDDDRGRGVEVLHVPGDDRIIAAKLEHEDLARRFGELLVQCAPGAARAREQQAVDPGLRGQRLAFLGSADQQPDPFDVQPLAFRPGDGDQCGHARSALALAYAAMDKIIERLMAMASEGVTADEVTRLLATGPHCCAT